MNTASRWMIVLGLAAAALGLCMEAPKAHAQDVEITGPLAGAPAVRRMRIYRDGRFQIQPTVGFTLQDEFARTMFAGAQIGYHFTDWLGINAFASYGVVSLETGLTDQVASRGQTTERNRVSLPSASGFPDQIGRLNFMGGAQVTFIPLRGKLALFQALFVDTDFYIFGGAAATQVEERANVVGNAAAACAPIEEGFTGDASGLRSACIATQKETATRIALAPTFGVGISLYLTDYMGLTLEYRAFPFKWNTSGTDEGGLNSNRNKDANGEFPDGLINDSDRIFHFNQMFNLGLAFYLPFQGDVTE
jgi:outer membrane beta-barrel protein